MRAGNARRVILSLCHSLCHSLSVSLSLSLSLSHLQLRPPRNALEGRVYHHVLAGREVIPQVVVLRADADALLDGCHVVVHIQASEEYLPIM